MGVVEYGVLGPLRAGREGGRPLTRGRGRDLLAVLLLRRDQAVDPAVLLDLVWREEAAALDASAVHTVVARLRRRLGSEAVITTGTGYRLGRGVVDAVRFREQVDQAAGLGGDARIELLRSALALWRGPEAYAGVSDHLVVVERPRLAELRRGAAEALAGALVDRHTADDLREAATISGDLLTEDPLRETAYALLMAAQARAGLQAAALETYDRARRILRHELGIDPGPSLQLLQQRTLAQDPALVTPGPVTTSPTAAVVATASPPAPITRTVGRESEVEALVGALADRRLVTISGPGGVGKSRLLVELHTRISPDRATAYVDLSGTSPDADAGDLADLACAALRLRPVAGDPLTALTAALAARPLVLLLDEVERVTSQVGDLVAAVGRSCPDVQVVVTSRRPLGRVGEHVVPLAPLAGPAAVELLVDRLRDRVPDLVVDADVLPRLAEAAQRVDGLPLALELLAGYAGAHSLGDLWELAASPLDLRADAADEVDRPGRHRSVRTAIAWSLDRLPPDLRRTLGGLSAFAGPFDLAAAEAVVEATTGRPVRDDLRALAREGLVQVQRQPDRLSYRLLRTVREVAAEQPDLADVRRTAIRRHRDHHAARWRGAPRSDALLREVREHFDDYLQALRGALVERDAATLADLTIVLCRLWVFADLLGPGLRWSSRVLDSGLLNPLEDARIRVLRASLTLHHSPDSARAETADAIPRLREEGDDAWLVTALLIAALERLESGDPDAALLHARESVDVAAGVSNERHADALGVLAIVAAPHDRTLARASANQAWALALGSGSLAARASVASNLSLALLQAGHADDALTMLDEAAAVLGDDVPVFLVVNLGWAALASDPARALACFSEAVAASADATSDRRAAELYAGAGCALHALGRPESLTILVGARDLVDRLGMTLLPVQRADLDARLADAPSPAVSEPVEYLGRRLAELVLAASRSARSSARTGMPTGAGLLPVSEPLATP